MGQPQRELDPRSGPHGTNQTPGQESSAGRQESADSIDRFVSVVSHELRGPLATIAGYAQMLQRGDALSASVRERANAAILEQSRNVNFIIENLLQASRITGNRLRIERTEADLVPVLQKAVSERAGAQEHRFRVDLPSVPVLGHFDRPLIGLAFANLVSNAVKFSAQTEITLRVSLVDGDAEVTINDRGIGIDPGDMDDLFAPYHRPARTARYPGVGVGLYVSKGIIEAHGGQITVESVPGNTTFRVILPLG